MLTAVSCCHLRERGPCSVYKYLSYYWPTCGYCSSPFKSPWKYSPHALHMQLQAKQGQATQQQQQQQQLPLLKSMRPNIETVQCTQCRVQTIWAWATSSWFFMSGHFITNLPCQWYRGLPLMEASTVAAHILNSRLEGKYTRLTSAWLCLSSFTWVAGNKNHDGLTIFKHIFVPQMTAQPSHVCHTATTST